MCHHANKPRVTTIDTTTMDRKEIEAKWGKEWSRLAEVVDRVFFWTFLIGIICTTLLLFYPLTIAHYSRSRLVVLAK